MSEISVGDKVEYRVWSGTWRTGTWRTGTVTDIVIVTEYRIKPDDPSYGEYKYMRAGTGVRFLRKQVQHE